MIASLPPNWDYNIQGLATTCMVGKDAIRTCLNELENAGYLEREQLHGEGGRFGGWLYVVHDVSRAPADESPDIPPSSEKPTTVKPTTVEPMADKPSSGNPTQVKKEGSKERSSNSPEAPQGGRKRRAVKTVPEWKPERFEKFWNFYSKYGHASGGKDRVGAVREWDALKPDDALIDKFAIALSRQTQTDEWQCGVGIPYACRWLKYRRWEDLAGVPDDPPEAGGTGWAADPEVTT